MPAKESWLFFKRESLIIRVYNFYLQFSTKISANDLVKTITPPIFAFQFNGNGFVAQLDRAPDYGSGGLGFESLRDHNKHK